MKLKYFLFLGVLFLPLKAKATWDVTTPAGSESKSLGDDRIRELKTDIQTSLQFGSTQYFPGSDTANPRYIPTISTVTTATRPTGNSAPVGRLIINTSSNTLEIRSTSTWSAVDVVNNASINENDLNSSVAGNGLSGGAGTPLAVNVDTQVFQISGDTISLANTPVINSSITLNGSLTRPTIPAVLAISTGVSTIVAANTLVALPVEIFDQSSNFASSSFTATITGKYMVTGAVHALWQADATKSQVQLSAGGQTFTFVGEHQGSTVDEFSISFSAVVSLNAGQQIYMSVNGNGTGNIAILDGGSSTTPHTFLSIIYLF